MATEAQKIQNAYDEVRKRQEEQNEQHAQLIENEAIRQAADLEAAQQARIDAQNQAQSLYESAQQNRDKSFADILSGYKQQEDEEAAEMEQKVKADKQAAKVTAYSELGAALANLFLVGNHNAVSQQHRNFSQDWMKKADADQREHRNRIDNLRDRQRALQSQIAQMKMGDAATALQYAQQQAAQGYQDALARSQARSNAVLGPAQFRLQAAQQAAQLGLQGAQNAANMGLHERQLAQSAQQHAESMNLQLAKAGMKRDDKGNFVVDKESDVYKANQAALRRANNKDKNEYYYTDKEGNLIPVYMTASEYDKFVQKAYAKLAEDKDFVKAIRKEMNDLERKSVIFQHAQMNDELRAELSRYGDYPEEWPKKPEQTRPTPPQTPVQKDSVVNPVNPPVGDKELGFDPSNYD